MALLRTIVLMGVVAFVQATDPEVLLILEARRDDASHQWQYGFARMTSRALRASHKEHEVWSVVNCWERVTADPKPERSSEVLTNSISMKLASVPAGEFLMGAPDSDQGARPIARREAAAVLELGFRGVFEKAGPVG